MTLKEARQSLSDLVAWSGTLTVKQFTSNGPADADNVDMLTQMQHDLTVVNTKLGNIVFQQSEPISEVSKLDPNAEHKSSSGQSTTQGRSAVPPPNPPLTDSKKPDNIGTGPASSNPAK